MYKTDSELLSAGMNFLTKGMGIIEGDTNIVDSDHTVNSDIVNSDIVNSDQIVNNTTDYRELMSSISPKTRSLSLVIRQFKQAITIYAKRNNIPFAWQRRFYETVITKQYELQRTWKYIENNVRNWKTPMSL